MPRADVSGRVASTIFLFCHSLLDRQQLLRWALPNSSRVPGLPPQPPVAARTVFLKRPIWSGEAHEVLVTPHGFPPSSRCHLVPARQKRECGRSEETEPRGTSNVHAHLLDVP